MDSPKQSRAVAFGFALIAGLMAAHLYGQPKTCCKVIRVDAEKGTVWLRNPASAVLVQINPGTADVATFKIDDQFNPDAGTLNGTKLDKKYVLVLPEIDEPNASIIRARGAEVAVKVEETGTVLRFYMPRFGPVLSSLRPGTKVLIDKSGKWAILRYGGADGKRTNVKPQVFAFELD
jgi:hypothetical protein